MASSIGLWVGFTLVVLVLLFLDLGVFHREAREVSRKEAGIWSAVWISLALVFNAGIYYTNGSEPALEFLAGYLIEKSLSVDNIFVFLLIFSYFSVPLAYQHRVLFWGILGALVMRGHFHCPRSDAATLFSLDHLYLRRFPDLYRHQACHLRRDRIRPGG